MNDFPTHQPVIIVMALDPQSREGQEILNALKFAAAVTKSPSAPPEVSGRQWYGVKSAAKYCGCSRSKIYADLQTGILIRDNLGGNLCPPQFKKETLDRYRSGLSAPRKKTHGNTKSIT